MVAYYGDDLKRSEEKEKQNETKENVTELKKVRLFYRLDKCGHKGAL